MTDLFLLSEAQMRRIERYFPLAHGIARVDDRRIVSAIVFVIKNGLRWRDAPRDYGPHKTIYNRFVRWSRLGVFNKIFATLARKGGKPERIMIDATHLKAHRTAASLLKKEGPVPRRIGRTRRAELQAARGLPQQRTPARHALKRGADERLQGRGADVACHAQGQTAPGRQQLRCRLVPRCPGKARRLRLHPLENPIGRSPSPMTPSSINSATRSKTCSAASKIGGASPPEMTVAPTPTSRQSASPQPSPFGSDQ